MPIWMYLLVYVIMRIQALLPSMSPSSTFAHLSTIQNKREGTTARDESETSIISHIFIHSSSCTSFLSYLLALTSSDPSSPSSILPLLLIMSSIIHYRFSSGLSDWSTLEFVGFHLSVREVKTRISLVKKMIQGGGGSDKGGSSGGVQLNARDSSSRALQDFELLLTNEHTHESYEGDNTLIPKNTWLVVKRIPANRARTVRVENEDDAAGAPAAKRAKLTNTSSPTATFMSPPRTSAVPPLSTPISASSAAVAQNIRKRVDEFGEDIWGAAPVEAKQEPVVESVVKEEALPVSAPAPSQPLRTQATPLHPKPLIIPIAPSVIAAGLPSYLPPQGVNLPSHAYDPTPADYVCKKVSARMQVIDALLILLLVPVSSFFLFSLLQCGIPGHWYRWCPLVQRGKRNKDGVKAIPMPQQASQSQYPQPTMSNAEAIAAAIAAANGHAAPPRPLPLPPPPAPTAASVTKAPTKSTLPASGIPNDLLCPICTNLINNAVVVPCCFSSFCDECIRQSLLTSLDRRCSVCQQPNLAVSQLTPNIRLQKRAEAQREKQAMPAHATAMMTAQTARIVQRPVLPPPPTVIAG